jgi:hypothetical protein
LSVNRLESLAAPLPTEKVCQIIAVYSRSGGL